MFYLNWESEVKLIIEARSFDILTMDELKKNEEKKTGEKRKEKNLVLKATERDDFEKENITLMTKRF